MVASWLLLLVIFSVVVSSDAQLLRKDNEGRSSSKRAANTTYASEIAGRDLLEEGEEKAEHDPDIVEVVDVNEDPHETHAKKNSHGAVITPRIVGGYQVARGKYGYFARVDKNRYPACGGVSAIACHCERMMVAHNCCLTVRSQHLYFVVLSCT